MDKSVLELLLRLMGSGQANNIGTSNYQNTNQNVYTNPAYANYPREAFISEHKTTAQSFNAETKQDTGQNLSQNNLLSSLGNLLNNNSDNNMLPLLLSILGKGNAGGLSSILETESKKTNKTEHETHDTTTIDDDILL